MMSSNSRLATSLTSPNLTNTSSDQQQQQQSQHQQLEEAQSYYSERMAFPAFRSYDDESNNTTGFSSMNANYSENETGPPATLADLMDFSGENLDAAMGLVAVLIQCFALILTGYLSGRWSGTAKTEQASHTLNLFVSYFALPGLIFKSLATMEDLNHFNWTFILSVLVAKLAVFTFFSLATLVSLMIVGRSRRNRGTLSTSSSTAKGWIPEHEFASNGSLYLPDESIDRYLSKSTDSLPIPTNLRAHRADMREFGQAGLMGIFVTQSNDFAFGYPLLKALYASNETMADYLYVLAPVQLVIINPLGLVLMEIGKARSNSNQRDWKICDIVINVFRGIVSNPVIIMTIAGLTWNLTLGPEALPRAVKITLASLGDAFCATALFLLGLRLVGKFRALKQGKNVQVTMATVGLTLVKIIILPLVMWFAAASITQGPSSEVARLTNFALLYGTFPVAPNVFVFSVQYKLPTTIVASGFVLSSTLAAPLMLLAANLIRTTATL